MDRQSIINYDKRDFMNFLNSDYTGEILELLNEEGVELLKKYEQTEERICYILNYSRYCNELFQKTYFLDMFLDTDISYYYASMYKIDKDAFNLIIKNCIENGKPDEFTAKLFSYFNNECKMSLIDNWPYSTDLLYEIFKKSPESLGPKIMQKYDIDLMSHDIDIPNLFKIGKGLYFKELESRFSNHSNIKKVDTLYIPSEKITKEMAQNLFDSNNIFKYRAIVNNAEYSCDTTTLNKYAKDKENKIISESTIDSLIYPFNKIDEVMKKLSTLDKNSDEYFDLKLSFLKLLKAEKLDEIGINLDEEISEKLQRLSNNAISNYIIDYHFEENYYNIMYDIKELLDFCYSGNISIPEEKLALYNKIAHIDEISLEDKKELHEELKKYNMIEMFYDDMKFARETVHKAIKDYSLTMDTMSRFKDEDLTKQYGVDVFNIKNEPFFALVKSGMHAEDDLPTGHSYSFIGDGCIGTYADASASSTFVYDAESLNSEQIVHLYPMDSFTLYKPFTCSEKASSRINTLLTPEELLYNTCGYNELLILEKGLNQTDIDVKIPKLKRMALYCIDKINERDVEVAKANGVGILLISSKEYENKDVIYSSIYGHDTIDYWNYNYFDGTYNDAEHSLYRM